MTNDPERIDPLATLPASIRDRIPSVTGDDLVTAAADPDRLGESRDDVERRRAAAHASKVRMWEARRPTRFASARVADLEDLQGREQVQGWVDRTPPYDTSLTLVLRSNEPGVGKSHAAYAAGNRAVSAGLWTLAWTAIKFNDAIRPGNDDTAYDVAQECDLLLLDDLGREKVSEWTLERLQSVLDARWSNEKRTIITTNLSGADLLTRYGDALVDRITDTLTMVLVDGSSRRRPLPW